MHATWKNLLAISAIANAASGASAFSITNSSSIQDGIHHWSTYIAPPHTLLTQDSLETSTTAVYPQGTPSTSTSGPQQVLSETHTGGRLIQHLTQSSLAIKTLRNPNNLPTITAIPPEPTPMATIIGTDTVLVEPSGIIIGSQTLRAGSAITLGSKTISLAPDSTALVIGSSTVTLARPASTLSSFAVAGQIVTSAPSGGFVIGGKTLSAGGPAVTVSGTVISLASSYLVVGSSTFALSSSPSPTPATLSSSLLFLRTGTPNAVATSSPTSVDNLVVGSAASALCSPSRLWYISSGFSIVILMWTL